MTEHTKENQKPGGAGGPERPQPAPGGECHEDLLEELAALVETAGERVWVPSCKTGMHRRPVPSSGRERWPR